MNCTGIARRCDDGPVSPYQLAGIPDKPIRRLCGACRKSASDLGYDPRPVPEWVARDNSRVWHAA